jgi:RNA polymerase sigma factor (sigma-70 family)
MSSAEAVSGEEHSSAPAPAPMLHLVPDVITTPRDETLTPHEQELVAGHLYMIRGAIRWVQRRREGMLDTEEAVGDVVLGLSRAAKRFDPTYQVTFEAFAAPAARGEIVDGERRRHKLTGPKRQQAKEPSLFNNSGTVSLDAPLKPGTTYTLLDVIPSSDDPVDLEATDQANVGSFYDSLPLTPRQKAVYFLKARKYTLREIASVLEVSPRTVSRDFKQIVGVLFAHYQPAIFDEDM